MERLVRRSERLDEREAVQVLNWALFGARRDEATGEWSKVEHRAGSCGKPLDDRVAAEVGEFEGTVTSSFGGVETCGSPWACAFCAAKVRGARAVEVGTIIRKHLEAGGHALFLTLTFSHARGESAADTFGEAMECWDRLVRSTPWKRLMKSLGRSGFIRTTEITHSHANSWHPHHHVALLTEVPLDEDLVAAVQTVVDRIWRKKAAKYGRRVHETAGVTLVPLRDAEGLGWYVSKMEMEIARGDLKRGYGDSRSPWQIALEAVANGEAVDFALWREYVMATKGRRSVSYSNGLLARFEMREQTDQELAERVNARKVVAFLPAPMYREVARYRGLAELRRLLEAGRDARALAAAVEAATGRRVGLLVRDVDIPAEDDSGPPVPTLVFVDPGQARSADRALVRR